MNAEDLDRNQSMTRRFNQNARNRLHQQQEKFQSSRELVENEIKHEVKRLQREMRRIRKTGNYESNARNLASGELRENEIENKFIMKRRTMKGQRRRCTRRLRTNEMNLSRPDQEKSVLANFISRKTSSESTSEKNGRVGSKLSNLKESKNTRPRDLINKPSDETWKNYEALSDEHGGRLKARDSRDGDHKTENHENETASNKHEQLPLIARSGTHESKQRELHVEEARSQARKRLLRENNTDFNTPTEDECSSNDGINPYMYVPPDGRKRTVYVLPPLQDLLDQARKARYLRIPKRFVTYEDDPERELSVEEIFRKTL